MPTYEYKCSACGHTFEEFQSITAAPVKKCPKCGKAKVNRLLGTGAGIIFKGSGFYITDYRSEAYKDSAKSESGSKESSEAKTDAKPAETKAGGETKAKETSDVKPAASEPKPAQVASKSASKANTSRPSRKK